MLGEIERTSIMPASCLQTRWIERSAYANDASYFRLVPQAVLQLNSILNNPGWGRLFTNYHAWENDIERTWGMPTLKY